MIKRYSNTELSGIWDDSQKVARWLRVELAVLEAKSQLGLIAASVFTRIRDILTSTPTDIEWWKAREKETKHDLQAWVEERARLLPIELRPFLHEGMTSYDTEEAPFALALKESKDIILLAAQHLAVVIKNLALKYRYTPMMARTHGQPAEPQTFGKRCLTWLGEIMEGMNTIDRASEGLVFSKLSGAVGNYGGLTPQIEEKALAILGLVPYLGATQIMPRLFYAPLAQAVCQLSLTIDKISTDIRLDAMTPNPLMQEPFGKNQTGSSRMPQKQNTITTEQNEGLADAALGYLHMTMLTIKTWHEREIHQSSVERIAWPDLFHVTMRSLTNITKVLEGLRVYPDNMMRGIIDTRGTWAAGATKEFLRSRLAEHGITTEEAYRMVQLASFNAFAPTLDDLTLRQNPPTSIADAQEVLDAMARVPLLKSDSIQGILYSGCLHACSELDASDDQIVKWNKVLWTIFTDTSIRQEWKQVFSLGERLKDEDYLFEKIL